MLHPCPLFIIKPGLQRFPERLENIPISVIFRTRYRQEFAFQILCKFDNIFFTESFTCWQIRLCQENYNWCLAANFSNFSKVFACIVEWFLWILCDTENKYVWILKWVQSHHALVCFATRIMYLSFNLFLAVYFSLTSVDIEHCRFSVRDKVISEIANYQAWFTNSCITYNDNFDYLVTANFIIYCTLLQLTLIGFVDEL